MSPKRWRKSRPPVGALTTLDDIPHYRGSGAQYFDVHCDPFVRRGPAAVKSALVAA
ncbi:hypothetical protein [Shinella sp. HZN7]|uniref:hypothetical protein n=1 Tax=Shinella sp. (strain HZN7) TaxID=879274 RepID=UPI000AA17E39|nr:hypothetical protein [Shinella sp. HZN7]